MPCFPAYGRIAVNRLLGADGVRHRVDELERIVTEGLAREEEMRKAHLGEERAIRERHALLRARKEESLRREREEWERTCRQEEERLLRHDRRRRERIERAHAACRSALRESLDRLREQRRYENQKILLLASREREQRSRDAERRWREAQGGIEAKRQHFEELTECCLRQLSGYRGFRLQGHEGAPGEAESVSELLDRMERVLKGLSWRILPVLFARIRWWFLLVLAGMAGAVFPVFLGEPFPWQWTGACSLGVLLLYGMGYLAGAGPARDLSRLHGRILMALEERKQGALRERDTALDTVVGDHRRTEEALELAWREVDAEANRRQEEGVPVLEHRVRRAIVEHEKRHQARLEAHRRRALRVPTDEAIAALEAEEARRLDQARERYERELEEWGSRWRERERVLREELETSRREADPLSVSRESPGREDSTLPNDGFAMARFARLHHRGPAGDPLDIPLVLRLPEGPSLLFESGGVADEAISSLLCGILVRLLAGSPPGGMGITLFDPVSLGRNFAGMMHLADHDEQIVNHRIRTQGNQMEQCLKDLTGHMERIMQMCLRNDYRTLADYNRSAGSMAERYRFLAVADFPAGFSETALISLRNILVGGPRCGIFLVMHRDTRHSLLLEGLEEDMRRHCERFTLKASGAVRWEGLAGGEHDIILDTPPPIGEELLHRLGRAHADGYRVELPFPLVAPEEERIWSVSTAEEIRVPLGRTSASRLQHLCLGRGLEQHALIVGKTGSGKSTLFHVLITNLSLWCSPDEVEFYLVDFKKGVEFKCYASRRLPHARVVAIESDREFGLSVLERVDAELHRRGELFRRTNVRDLTDYRRRIGKAMPRTLLLVDEFQEYFVEDDSVSQVAATLLDRIVRQGRAFGIHVILGSQTVGGSFTMARTTFAQMNIRIALQCDEADAALVMDESNTAARLLSRPGEGIYNAAGGVLEGNSPFQAAWLSDDERDRRLEILRQRAEGEGPLVVFEGNAPADLRSNALLASALRQAPAGGAPRCWLGEPNAIKESTEVVFRRQTGSHLLILGQNREVTHSLLAGALLSLAASDRRAGFWFLGSAGRHHFLGEVLAMAGERVRIIDEDGLGELRERIEAEEGASQFLFVPEIQLRRRLRPVDEFDLMDEGGEGPDAQLRHILEEGSVRGLHMVVSVDSYQGALRSFTRKSLQDFDARVLLQMSAGDSAALIDSTRANALGLHRALLFLESAGRLETFRPYAAPDAQWLEEAASLLQDGGCPDRVQEPPG